MLSCLISLVTMDLDQTPMVRIEVGVTRNEDGRVVLLGEK